MKRWLFGRRADRWRRPLRAYGLIALGIALSALAIHGALAIYPALYVKAAGPFLGSPAMLTAVRFLFAVVVMIVPTTLMGATLPVLSRYSRSAGTGLGAGLVARKARAKGMKAPTWPRFAPNSQA